MNKYVRWDSVGSDDTTTETITIVFDSVTISRIVITEHNLKDFSVTYGAGASSFSNVVGIDGAVSGIVEAAFAENTAYYEFDAVTTTQINILATKTQSIDVQKFITAFVTTNEIGTFTGYPDAKPYIDSNERRSEVLTGKYITQKKFDTIKCQLSLQHTEQNDIDIIESMYDSPEPFLVWLCGGRYGSAYFSVSIKNWRLQDLYQVQSYGAIKTTWRNNSYIGSPITSIKFAEEV